MRSQLNRRQFLKYASLLPLAALPLSKINAGTLPAGQAKNVLVVVFDALTARHMSVYGYGRNTTPNLARFAERSNVYHAHHAGGNFTTVGTASLLTGVYPWSHRAVHLKGTLLDDYVDQTLFSVFPSDGFTYTYTHNLLVEILLNQVRSQIDFPKPTRDLAIDDPQYSDRIFPADANASLWGEQLILRGGETKPSSLLGGLLYRFLRLSRKKQMVREFGRRFPRGLPNMDDVYYILEDAMDWLASELPGLPAPSLGYYHILPPHDPYYPPKDYIGIFKGAVQAAPKPPSPFTQGYSDETLAKRSTEYDEFLAYADAEFGRLFDAMVQNGVLENTTVVVTADHGEIFERGILGHVTPALYEPLIHIPLLICSPGQAQRQDFHTPTSCVDLLPTLASLYNQPHPEWTEGQILPGFSGQPAQEDRSIFAVEAKSSPKRGPLHKASFAVIKGTFKLIYYRGYENNPEVELYDLANDPEELHNLASQKSSLAAELQNEIEDKLRLTHSL